jgi:hypothetical protein
VLGELRGAMPRRGTGAGPAASIQLTPAIATLGSGIESWRAINAATRLARSRPSTIRRFRRRG